MNEALPAPAASRDPLSTYQVLTAFTVLTFVLLVVLVLVPVKNYQTEWRDLQNRYNALAVREGKAPIDVGIKQIWNPKMNVVDRCTSCHIGMGDGAPIPGHAVFGPHPEIPHDPARFGCVSCHLGQGRATSKAEAHGHTRHWESPMLEKGRVQASCGTCHRSVAVPTAEVAADGKRLFDLHGCIACHKVDGEGGTVGPDLSAVGLKGFDRQWHVRHLKAPAEVVTGSQMMNFGHLTDPELDAIIRYMDTLVGAPDLMEGKAIAATHGCRGCHSIQGAGGDAGPALDEVGSRSPHALDFKAVKGPHTLANWHKAHFKAPAKVVAGSRMPAPALSDAEIEKLVTWVLSLQKTTWSLDQLPKKEAVARLEARRDHGGTGADVYRVYCSACHGARGEGRDLPELATRGPSVTNPDFLAVAGDDYLRATLDLGREGRNMPAWGTKQGGLTAAEIEAVIAFLRQSEPQPPSFEAVMAEAPDAALGRQLFTGSCASCHGADAQGNVIGPSLVTPELLEAVDDRFLYRTIVLGRPGTAMPSHKGLGARQVRALIAYLDGHRTKPRLEPSTWRAAGSVSFGEAVYRTQCASCHGAQGEGGIGTALANQAFLASVSDAFLAHTIREGRTGRPMRPFGKGKAAIAEMDERSIEDVVTYLRSLQSPFPQPVLKGKVQGDVARGRAEFSTMCAGCHGTEGAGLTAPALNNPGFLAAASDGYLQATIVRGRAGTAMRSWSHGGFADLDAQQVNDIVSYVRSWERKDAP